MRLIERGSGSPRVAVVGGIHGDEPAGDAIVERLIAELSVDAGTIQLLIANEPALAAGTRYTETDLNRAFPGDPDSDDYEAVLATRVMQVLEGADAVLAIHTSRSVPPPFAIFSERTAPVRRTVTALPVEYVVDASGLRSTTMDSMLPHTVSIEAGKQGSDEAVEFGTECAYAFLRAHGILRDSEPTFAPKQIVRAIEEVPKSGGDPHLYYHNFEAIPEGAVFAEDDEYTHRVESEGVVPILASEHGYDDIFGLYGEFDGTLDPPETETPPSDDVNGETSAEQEGTTHPEANGNPQPGSAEGGVGTSPEADGS
ncbi:succinylglutamate desuccinylase [Halobacteriales archaeon SW_10_66_29]|nr:MAG: succinylglutamate desuccinylase [Halobacteriales archaeon SW_10_66_29]